LALFATAGWVGSFGPGDLVVALHANNHNQAARVAARGVLIGMAKFWNLDSGFLMYSEFPLAVEVVTAAWRARAEPLFESPQTTASTGTQTPVARSRGWCCVSCGRTAE
jgi:hypothetical protein